MTWLGSNDYIVSSGQTSAGLMVNAGDTLTVLTGGIANAAVLNGGTETMLGGSASGTTVSNGGVMTVSGGTARNTTISSGGRQVAAAGNVVSTVISAGGLQTVSGGRTSGTLVTGGGSAVILAGSASTMQVTSGGSVVVSGGTDGGTVLYSGGTETVVGGAFNGTTISSGGLQTISGGSGSLSYIYGTQVVSGGTIRTSYVWTGGRQTVYGGDVVSVGLQGGRQTVYGGNVSFAVVNNGGMQTVSGGIVTSSVIGTNGTLVYAGGTLTNTRLTVGGVLDLANFAYSESGSVVLNSTTNVLTVSANGQATTVQLDGNYAGEYFRLGRDAGGGTTIYHSNTLDPVPVILASLAQDTGLSSTDGITRIATLRGTALAGRTLRVQEGGTTLGSVLVAADGTFSLTPVLADGAHTLTLSETNATGQTGSATLSLTLDTAAPTVAITSPGGPTANVLQLVSGTASVSEAGRSVILLDGGVQVGSGTVKADGTWRADAAFVAAGSHSLTAQVSDLAGNVGSSGAVAYAITLPTGTVSTDQSKTLGAQDSALVLAGTGLTGIGNASANLLVSTAGGNLLDGGDGNDTLVSGTGADTLVGGAGLDYVDYSASAEGVTVNMVTGVNHGGNAEGDVLSGIEVVIGSVFGDMLTSDGGGHYLFAGGGNDTLVAGAGGTNMYGEDGDDSIQGGSGNDLLNGGTGNDTMAGGAGNDVYNVDSLGDVVTENANEGIDLVQASISYVLGANLENLTLLGSLGLTGTGNALANVIQGSSGNDLVYGLGGNDDLRGNLGDDTLDGGEGNDSLYGGDGADSLLGGIGNDVLYGGTGMDTLLGGDGNDVLDGGTGADSMAGGLGDDTYYVDNAGDVVTELANEGRDTAYVSVSGWTMAANLEVVTLNVAALLTGNNDANQVTGSAGNDTVYGLDGNDDLRGYAGNDVLDGGLGNDALYGGDGNDSLLGGIGNDTLRGEAGNDTLVGGAGNDQLLGGAGADLFVWGTDALGGVDSISDFSRADGDKLDLSALHLTQVAAHTGAGQFTLTYYAASQATAVNIWSAGNAGAAANLTITAYAAGTGQLIASDFKL